MSLVLYLQQNAAQLDEQGNKIKEKEVRMSESVLKDEQDPDLVFQNTMEALNKLINFSKERRSLPKSRIIMEKHRLLTELKHEDTTINKKVARMIAFS